MQPNPGPDKRTTSAARICIAARKGIGSSGRQRTGAAQGVLPALSVVVHRPKPWHGGGQLETERPADSPRARCCLRAAQHRRRPEARRFSRIRGGAGDPAMESLETWRKPEPRENGHSEAAQVDMPEISVKQELAETFCR